MSIPLIQVSDGGISRVTVLHIEDDILWADATDTLMRPWSEVRLIGTSPNGRDGIRACLSSRPNIVILDLGLPDINGFTVWDHLLAMDCRPKILLLTARSDEALLYRLFLGEASGLIRKRADFADHLRPALRAIASGRNYFPLNVSQEVQRYRRAPDALHKFLSQWELKLVSFLAGGAKDAEIAEKIGRSRGTIRNHWHIIAGKLGLRDRHELRTWAQAKGFFADSQNALATVGSKKEI